MNRQTEALFFNHSALGMISVDQEMKILSVNDAFTGITGYSREEALGQTPNMLSSGKHSPAFYAQMLGSLEDSGFWMGEIWNRRKNGEVYPEFLTVNAIGNETDTQLGYIGIFADILHSKSGAGDRGHLARHDPLTGLANRLLLNIRLEKSLELVKRTSKKLAVLLIDLDGFKAVNDSFGHSSGDLVLLDVVNRLLDVVRNVDMIARWGGDEFVAVLEGINTERDAAAIAAKVVEVLREPFAIEGQFVHLGCSIGISVFPDDGGEMHVRYADTAMRHAKNAGGNQFRFYKRKMTEIVQNQISLAGDLRNALDCNQLELHYQPQYCVCTGEMLGVEALIRWQHPEKGMIPPDQFIGLAEEIGLIIPIGTWVLETACQQAVEWANNGTPIQVAVNVSAKQLTNSSFCKIVEGVLSKTKLAPHLLEIELTESLMIEDIERSINTFQLLSGLGISLAVDDFGTGFSSLSYLTQLPVKKLKIDRSFIKNMSSNSADKRLVNSIVALGHSLGLTVVSEGIETREQLNYLKEINCDLVQGYLLSKPVKAEEITFKVLCV